MTPRSAAWTIALGVPFAVAVMAVSAEEPTVTDIATCNQEATARTAGSALPGGGEPQAQQAPRGTDETHRTPGALPSPGQPGDAVQQPRATGPGPTVGGGAGEKSDQSGSIISRSPDPLLKGMDAEKAADPAYRAAYRECMSRQIGRAR